MQLTLRYICDSPFLTLAQPPWTSVHIISKSKVNGQLAVLPTLQLHALRMVCAAGHAHLEAEADDPHGDVARPVPSPQAQPSAPRGRGRPRKHPAPPACHPRPHVAKDVAFREDELRQMARGFAAKAGARDRFHLYG